MSPTCNQKKHWNTVFWLNKVIKSNSFQSHNSAFWVKSIFDFCGNLAIHASCITSPCITSSPTKTIRTGTNPWGHYKYRNNQDLLKNSKIRNAVFTPKVIRTCSLHVPKLLSPICSKKRINYFKIKQRSRYLSLGRSISVSTSATPETESTHEKKSSHCISRLDGSMACYSMLGTSK